LSLLILFFYPLFLQHFYPTAKTSPLQGSLSEEALKESVQKPVLPPDNQLTAEEKKFDLETPLYKTTFTNLGGGMTSLSLNKYENGRIHENFLIAEDKDVPAGFATRVFESGAWTEGVFSLEKKERLLVVLVQDKAGSYRIKKSFWFSPNQYMFEVEVVIENLAAAPQSFQYELVAPLFIGDTPNRERIDLEADYVYGGQMDVKPAQKVMKEGFLKEGPADWVALEKKYFALIVKPEVSLDRVRSIFHERSLLDFLKPNTVEIASGATVSQKFLVYAGPKDYEKLKDSHMGFEKILHTKFLGGLWIYFLIMLKFFYKIFHNYGVAIIVLSAVIKLLFTPLAHMSFDSMRKMQALQPKLKALQEQYKKDPQRLNQEVMDLYKRNKVNPFGGCLPLLLQMPIFIALYKTFSQAIELRGASFVWWIKDLSEPDRLFTLPFSLPLLGNQVNVLPVLMIGTMLWQQKLTPQTAATKEQQMMTTLMPAMFGLIFYNLPSGLVIYWIVNNVLTIAHQLLMKKLHVAPQE